MKNSSIIDKIAGNKTVRKVSIIAIVASILIIWISIATVTYKSPEQKAADEKEAAAKIQRQSVLADEVTTALNEFSDSNIIYASNGGRQGSLVRVEADDDVTAKVYISTYFDDAGEENDGGQNIARRLFTLICHDVPELDSLYVHSESTGLDSRSVYRAYTPACKSAN